MKKVFYPDYFNDVFGPIMQPGSSGGFAGTDRVARQARHALGSELKRAEILFNPSDKRLVSLGTWWEDYAYLGGLLDYDTENIRLFCSHQDMRDKGISYRFAELEKDSPYAESTTFKLTGANGEKATLIGSSIGGGMIDVYEINGFKIGWRGDTYATLIWKIDSNGNIADLSLENVEKVFSDTFGNDGVLIKRVTNALSNVGLWVELSRELGAEDIYEFLDNLGLINGKVSEEGLFFSDINNDGNILFRNFPCILPVVTKADRKPQLFSTVTEWKEIAKRENKSFIDVAIQYEKDFSGWSEEEIRARFELIADILYKQVHGLEDRNYEVDEVPELPIYGKSWKRYIDDKKELSDNLTKEIITRALSTNAKIPGVKIVPGPMGTGGGYLFSAVDAVREKKGYSKDDVINGLIVAAGFGAIAYTRSNPSGERGCVGESGVCAAMAAAAVTAMAGGSADEIENAASMALQASFGITCDAIPGGKEFPCITRTVRAAVTAPLYADLALSGIDPLIPYHEVIDAMEVHYRRTPQRYLCGTDCALCQTPAAGECLKFMAGDVMADRIEYNV